MKVSQDNTTVTSAFHIKTLVQDIKKEIWWAWSFQSIWKITFAPYEEKLA